LFRETLERICSELGRVGKLCEEASVKVRRAGRKAKRAILMMHAGRLGEA